MVNTQCRLSRSTGLLGLLKLCPLFLNVASSQFDLVYRLRRRKVLLGNYCYPEVFTSVSPLCWYWSSHKRIMKQIHRFNPPKLYQNKWKERRGLVLNKISFLMLFMECLCKCLQGKWGQGERRKSILCPLQCKGLRVTVNLHHKVTVVLPLGMPAMPLLFLVVWQKFIQRYWTLSFPLHLSPAVLHCKVEHTGLFFSVKSSWRDS